MKTNVDLNSPQEEKIFKSKEGQKNKEINNDNKNEEISKINDANNDENDEKNKEDKNINNEKNNNIIIEKKNVDNKEYIKKEENINDIIKNVIEEEKNEEDPLITYITSNRKISDEEIQNSSKLILEEIEGNLFNRKKIEINTGDMIGRRGIHFWTKKNN